MQNDDYVKIEQHLAGNTKLEEVIPDPHDLSKNVQKQAQTHEFLRLGAVGVFSMLLVLFAPLLMRRKNKLIIKKGKL